MDNPINKFLAPMSVRARGVKPGDIIGSPSVGTTYFVIRPIRKDRFWGFRMDDESQAFPDPRERTIFDTDVIYGTINRD